MPVVLITVVYMLIGFYTLSDHSLLWRFVYPTEYHFVSSIVITYIPYYIILKIDHLKKHLPIVMGIIGFAAIIVYVFAVNKTTYNIDNVRSPFIKFLFMESMLLGAYFKQNEKKYKDRFSPWIPVAAIAFFGLYFASKMLFTKKVEIVQLQIANQIIIFVLLYFIFRLFASLDEKLTKLPEKVKSVISFLANMALEIYVVQSSLIKLLSDVAPFPLNWLAITAAIIASAFILHIICNNIMRFVDFVILKIKGESSKAKS